MVKKFEEEHTVCPMCGATGAIIAPVMPGYGDEWFAGTCPLCDDNKFISHDLATAYLLLADNLDQIPAEWRVRKLKKELDSAK